MAVVALVIATMVRLQGLALMPTVAIAVSLMVLFSRDLRAFRKYGWMICGRAYSP